MLAMKRMRLDDLFSNLAIRPSSVISLVDAKYEIRPLLRKVYDALPDGGGLLIAEKLLDPDNIAAHMQTLNMLICTEGKERTLEEYTGLLRGAGFDEVRAHLTGAPLDAVLAIKS